MAFQRIQGLFVVAAMLVATQARADLLKLNYPANPTKINNVPVAPTAVATVNNQTIPMTAIGAALRVGKKFLFQTPVFVVQVYVSDASKYVKSCNNGVPTPDLKSLTSLQNEPYVAVHLDYVYGPNLSDTLAATEDGFKTEDLTQSDAAVSAFINAITPASNPIQAGQSWNIVFQKGANSDSMIFEGGNGIPDAPVSAPSLMEKIMYLWMGKAPVDDALMGNCIQQLICGA